LHRTLLDSRKGKIRMKISKTVFIISVASIFSCLLLSCGQAKEASQSQPAEESQGSADSTDAAEGGYGTNVCR